MAKRNCLLIIEPMKMPIDRAKSYIDTKRDLPRYLIEREGFSSPLRDYCDFRKEYKWDGSEKMWDEIFADIKEDLHFYYLVIQ